MSEEAELWLGSVDRKFAVGPGSPAICVQYADCPHCKAKAGQLCQSDAGSPTLGHHWRRATAYTGLRRAGKVPPTSSGRDAQVLYLTRLAREQGESGEHHEDATHRRHFTNLAILNLTKAVELLVRGKTP